jgi:hypothetical protein
MRSKKTGMKERPKKPSDALAPSDNAEINKVKELMDRGDWDGVKTSLLGMSEVRRHGMACALGICTQERGSVEYFSRLTNAQQGNLILHAILVRAHIEGVEPIPEKAVPIVQSLPRQKPSERLAHILPSDQQSVDVHTNLRCFKEALDDADYPLAILKYCRLPVDMQLLIARAMGVEHWNSDAFRDTVDTHRAYQVIGPLREKSPFQQTTGDLMGDYHEVERRPLDVKVNRRGRFTVHFKVEGMGTVEVEAETYAEACKQVEGMELEKLFGDCNWRNVSTEE